LIDEGITWRSVDAPETEYQLHRCKTDATHSWSVERVLEEGPDGTTQNLLHPSSSLLTSYRCMIAGITSAAATAAAEEAAEAAEAWSGTEAAIRKRLMLFASLDKSRIKADAEPPQTAVTKL